MKGKLFLIPTTLGESPIDQVIPRNVIKVVIDLDYFIVENIRTARRFIRKAAPDKTINELTFFILNKNTEKNQLTGFMQPLYEGYDMGILSEAGVPGIADPGEELVCLAHQKQIRVVPLVGPSSITLAIMASGLNGQNFAFAGYLPIKSHERIKKLKLLEKKSSLENQTQVFMETPYRNDQLLKDILENCRDHTLLCIASNITLENEMIQTKSIREWKNTIPELNKLPAIFLLSSS